MSKIDYSLEILLIVLVNDKKKTAYFIAIVTN